MRYYLNLIFLLTSVVLSASAERTRIAKGDGGAGDFRKEKHRLIAG